MPLAGARAKRWGRSSRRSRLRQVQAVMHRARTFFYVCAGIFLLALSYHLGARSAGAQAPTEATGFVLASCGTPVIIYPDGDVLEYPIGTGPWSYRTNVFGGNAVGRTVIAASNNAALASNGEVF